MPLKKTPNFFDCDFDACCKLFRAMCNSFSFFTKVFNVKKGMKQATSVSECSKELYITCVIIIIIGNKLTVLYVYIYIYMYILKCLCIYTVCICACIYIYIFLFL